MSTIENNVTNENTLPDVGYHTHNDSDGTPSLWKRQPAIDKPTGGATVDAQSRIAIGKVIDALKALGFTF